MQSVSYSIINKVEAGHWWFKVRRELLTRLVGKFLDKKSGASILDIGCGTGLTSQLLEKYGEVYSVDPAPEAIAFCKELGLKNVTQGEIEHLPFADNKFDLVIALDVLEHVENDQAAVNEIRRVLKPGGIFICYVPAFKWLWCRNDTIRMHKRRYTIKTLTRLFGADFWRVVAASYFNFFLLPFIYLARKVEKFRRTLPDELEQMGVCNGIFYRIFKSELPIITRLKFHVGVSLYAVFKKR